VRQSSVRRCCRLRVETRAAVAADSVDGPLPEVVVRDVTGDSWVQLANFLPAESFQDG
jgi:hypothetical protein